ncbi:MAG: UDP-N-acetylmuramate--L-alanine ligase [Euzebya sp.]
MSPSASLSDAVLSPDVHVHLVGVGGSGMGAVAQVLLERGMSVSGSDLRDGPTNTVLRGLGGRITIGHDQSLVEGAGLVVISNAVPEDNVELRRAHELGIPVILRADLLEMVMAGQRRILISGTHGKTTTTAMTAVALQACGMDPSYAIGGSLPGRAVAGASPSEESQPTGAHHGSGDVFVAEADEAFRSFLRLTPDVAVITNLEMDHHDVYADLDAYRQAFLQFLDRRVSGGLALLCADDLGTRDLARDVTDPMWTYGMSAGADIGIHDVTHTPSGGATFRLTGPQGDLGQIRLAVPGVHNILNAAAALTAVRWVGGDGALAAGGLHTFSGALRRFQRLGTVAGICVVDDYGHHPTELRATLAAAAQANPDGRVIAVFQPHRYSRTQAMGADLGRALTDADVVIITDIYTAGEAPIPGVTGAVVAEAAAQTGAEVRYVPDQADLPALLAQMAREGDLILTMGAGDITTLGPEILKLLAERK